MRHWVGTLVATALLILIAAPVMAHAGIDAATNVMRASQGLPALQTSAQLNAVAAQRAQEIVSDFSHTQGLTDRLGCWSWGENIAWHTAGFYDDDAGQFVHEWWSSPSHQANIVGNWTQQGSAMFSPGDGRVYAVQLFLRPCVTDPVSVPQPGVVPHLPDTEMDFPISVRDLLVVLGVSWVLIGGTIALALAIGWVVGGKR